MFVSPHNIRFLIINGLDCRCIDTSTIYELSILLFQQGGDQSSRLRNLSSETSDETGLDRQIIAEDDVIGEIDVHAEAIDSVLQVLSRQRLRGFGVGCVTFILEFMRYKLLYVEFNVVVSKFLCGRLLVKYLTFA